MPPALRQQRTRGAKCIPTVKALLRSPRLACAAGSCSCAGAALSAGKASLQVSVVASLMSRQ